MKFLISALMILTSAAALGTPAVGDYAKYDVSITQEGSMTPVTATLEQAVLDYNATTNQFSQTIITTVTGETPSRTQTWIDAARFVSDAEIKDILSNCTTTHKGQLATVSTPVGNISTCAMSADDDSETTTFWIAAVPFGIVKADVLSKTTGSHTHALLNTYKAGTN